LKWHLQPCINDEIRQEFFVLDMNEDEMAGTRNMHWKYENIL
jgi:hypothetical protein